MAFFSYLAEGVAQHHWSQHTDHSIRQPKRCDSLRNNMALFIVVGPIAIGRGDASDDTTIDSVFHKAWQHNPN